jgi:ketosteroid isomerase-like protein
MSQENVEIVRRVFAASARRDGEAILALYDIAVEWDASRVQPFGESAGVARGQEGIRRFFRDWLEAWDSDEYRCEELVDAGDAVVSVVTQHTHGRASGVEIARQMTGVWTIRAGKVLRVVWFRSRDEALQAAGLGR